VQVVVRVAPPIILVLEQLAGHIALLILLQILLPGAVMVAVAELALMAVAAVAVAAAMVVKEVMALPLILAMGYILRALMVLAVVVAVVELYMVLELQVMVAVLAVQDNLIPLGVEVVALLCIAILIQQLLELLVMAFLMVTVPRVGTAVFQEEEAEVVMMVKAVLD
jgi:hypothetical protein